jgi:7-keto-8-aminopelargonate synthetase-like enzyme
VAEELGVSGQIEIQMGTLGKAVGAAGGYICGSRRLIDFLINRARSFIFSTAPVPASAAAAIAGLRLIQSSEGEARRQALWQHLRTVNAALVASPPAFMSPILPILIGEENQAVEVAQVLRDRGIFIPAIRYPTVARGRARLRLTLSAAHTQAQVRELITAARELGIVP